MEIHFGKFLIVLYIVLVKTVCCAAAIPEGNSQVQNDNEDFHTTRGDIIDNPSQIVEPTMSAGEGDAVVHSVTSINDMTTGNNGAQTAPGEEGEWPEVSRWLQALRDLEAKSKMVGSNNGGHGDVSPTKSLPDIAEEEIELPSPDQFFKWLDSKPPLQKEALKTGNKNVPDSETGSSVEAHPHDAVHKLGVNIHGSELILIICVPVGAVVVCVLLIGIFIVYRKNISAKKVVDSKFPSHGGLNRNSNVFSVDNKDITFMEMPSNNQIWKELQMLPSTASSVLPESVPT